MKTTIILSLLLTLSATAFAQQDTILKPPSTESSFKVHHDKSSKLQSQLKRYHGSRFVAGDKFVGMNLSFGAKDAENDFLIANIDVPQAKKNILSASVVAGYFLSPITSVGGRFIYNYSKNDQLLVADFLGLAFNADEYRTQNLATGFETHAFMRNYFPIGSSKNLYFVNEISLYYAYQGSYSRAISDPGKPNERIRKVMSDKNYLGIGISPGITYFSSNRLAIEFQLGTTGFEYVFTKHLTDDTTEGYVNQFSFRDALSFLRVKFGLTFYFN